MEIVQSGIFLILMIILKKNLTLLSRLRDLLKLLKKLPIIKTIHLPELTLFLHVILA